jgi:hypothetical protein
MIAEKYILYTSDKCPSCQRVKYQMEHGKLSIKGVRIVDVASPEGLAATLFYGFQTIPTLLDRKTEILYHGYDNIAKVLGK